MRVYHGIGFGSGMCRGRIWSSEEKQCNDVSKKSSIAVYQTLPNVFELLSNVGISGPLGLILPEFNPYSHVGWAISYVGVPAIMMEYPIALDFGVVAYLDADQGILLFPESIDEIRSLDDEYDNRLRLDQEVQSRAFLPAVSLAGLTVSVLAQIQCVEDVSIALEFGADGVGEIKSELLNNHGGSTDAVEIINAIKSLTSWAEIPIRFYDFDGEKYGGLRGYNERFGGSFCTRGIRVLEREGHLLDEFLEMFDGVSLEGVVVVLPMITLPTEVQLFRERLNGRPIRLGVLVETPAAALNIEDFNDVSDYFEIGLNDLTQFTMAWDRVVPHWEFMPINKFTRAVEQLISNVASKVRKRHGFASLAIDLPPTAQLVRQVLSSGMEAVVVPPRLIPRWKEQIRLAL